MYIEHLVYDVCGGQARSGKTLLMASYFTETKHVKILLVKSVNDHVLEVLAVLCLVFFLV